MFKVKREVNNYNFDTALEQVEEYLQFEHLLLMFD